jgi:hypothetical protein
MKMGTPRSEQGQTVERSYGWGGDGRYYMRRHNRGLGQTRWYVAERTSEIPESYDAATAEQPPLVRDWRPCSEPSDE